MMGKFFSFYTFSYKPNKQKCESLSFSFSQFNLSLGLFSLIDYEKKKVLRRKKKRKEKESIISLCVFGLKEKENEGHFSFLALPCKLWGDHL